MIRLIILLTCLTLVACDGPGKRAVKKVITDKLTESTVVDPPPVTSPPPNPPPVVEPPPPPPPPIVETTVDVVRYEGDYFKGALIEVESNGEWSYSITTGTVIETETGLEIRSNGQLGVYEITIDGEQYQYEFVEPPVCEHTLSGSYDKFDCLGNPVGPRSAGMVYYGEDDTQVVTIEVGVVRSSTSCSENCEQGTPLPVDHPARIQALEGIDDANEFHARNGV